ncbi:MAG: 4a-hydroxytetrahydrobiopterin dehydratase [Burkholderiaceae bacterium]
MYSNEAPLALPQDERFGQGRRLLVPLFVDCAPDLGQFSLPRRLEFLARLEPEQIGYADWSTMIGPLLDRIAVRLSLKDHPDADAYPEPDPANARTQALGDDELARTLRFDDFEGWYVDSFGHADARYLVKAFMFRDFDQAVDFMARVSEHCRVLDHHPEWRNVFNQVSVSLTTWDAHRRVTLYDLELALFMNRVAKTIAQARQGTA